MNKPLDLALKLSDEITNFPLGNCGPSDDPDKQYAYTCSFRDLAIRFVSAIKRIGDPDLSEQVSSLDLNISNFISEAHLLKAELQTIIDSLNEISSDPNYAENVANNSAFLNTEVLCELKAIKDSRLDVSKLIKLCEELNDAYARANYISSALLIRTVLNHVPSVFGSTNFNDVVEQSGRSAKAILKRLNDEARPIADLHTHILMREKENLPSKNQIEPYKAAFEVLIQEVVVKLSNKNV